MNRMFSSLLVTALMATACGETPKADIDSLPGLETMEGTNGTPGTNGLGSDIFHALSYDLYLLTQAPLYSDLENGTISTEVIQFLGSTEGQQVFDYAIGCALPAGTAFSYLNNNNVKVTVWGGGIVTTADQWSSSALSESAMEDLFTCMIAHLNPLGLNVPIFLSGPSVDDKEVGSLYPVEEAVWSTRLTEVGIFYDVWPLFPVPEACASDPYEALKTRVCGQNAEACNLVSHTTFVEDCVAVVNAGGQYDGGHYVCNGRPAIKTWLQSAEYLPDLYPACYPPPV